MSRAGDSASSNETTAVQRPSSLSLAAGVRPKLGLHGLEVHLPSKLLCLDGHRSCNWIPPQSGLWKKARTSPVCSQSPSRAAGRLSQKHLPCCLGPSHRDSFHEDLETSLVSPLGVLPSAEHWLCSDVFSALHSLSLCNFHLPLSLYNTAPVYRLQTNLNTLRVLLYKPKSLSLNKPSVKHVVYQSAPYFTSYFSNDPSCTANVEVCWGVALYSVAPQILARFEGKWNAKVFFPYLVPSVAFHPLSFSLPHSC